MAYTSIKQICKEFGINDSMDVETIKKELTQMQKELHPDTNDNYTQQDEGQFSRITEAKEFLKRYDTTLVPVSEIADLLQIVKKENEISKIKNLEENLLQSIEKKVLEIKHSYLPRKITAGSVMAVITFLWAFPSALKEHPIIGQYFETVYDGGYLILTIIWLMLVIGSIELLLITFMRESRLKHILYDLEKLNNQYKIFSWFINEIQNNEFTQQDLEAYIIQHVSVDKKISKFIRKQIEAIVPQISEMLIIRALEKGIIRKAEKVSWYDTYNVVITRGNENE